MIVGIGIDLVEMDRIREIIAEKESFVKRVLTEKEWQLFDTLSAKRQVEFLAGRFACKEAFSKALGTGIGPVSFQEIEVLRGERGEPVITKSPFAGQVFVSITHTDLFAMAQIILEEKEG